MTKEEDDEVGNLTATFNYIAIVQCINAAIHFLMDIKAKFDIAAIEKGVIRRERRTGDRRARIQTMQSILKDKEGKDGNKK